jgi:N-acetylglucosamine kinase-like BadF-type ATPase
MQVLAVDGGQSAIRVRHSSGGASVEIDGVSRQEGDTVAAVVRAIETAWDQVGRPPVDRAVLGLTTAPTAAGPRALLCASLSERVGAHEVWLADDAVTTHAGALSLGWGVSVAAGTGVACLALPRDPDAGPRIIGGHGFLLGDEGGAFWIGRAGLVAALRAHDGRGEPTALVDAAAGAFDGLDDLGDRLHSVDRPVNRIAHFAPAVLRAADAGDPVADGIASAAAQELALLIRAGAVAAAGPDDPPPGSVPVALSGRLLEPGSPLRTRLERAAPASAPAAALRSADATALDGALLLGHSPDPGRYARLVHRWESIA